MLLEGLLSDIEHIFDRDRSREAPQDDAVFVDEDRERVEGQSKGAGNRLRSIIDYHRDCPLFSFQPLRRWPVGARRVRTGRDRIEVEFGWQAVLAEVFAVVRDLGLAAGSPMSEKQDDLGASVVGDRDRGAVERFAADLRQGHPYGSIGRVW